MTDDRKGECKSCGENAGNKPAAKSAAEIAREYWLEGLSVRPYQPSVEARSAAIPGEAAIAATDPQVRAHPPALEFPIEPQVSAPHRQLGTLVTHLPAPWDQPANRDPGFSRLPEQGFAAPDIESLAGSDSVEYLTWEPGPLFSDDPPERVQASAKCTCRLTCGKCCPNPDAIFPIRAGEADSNVKCESMIGHRTLMRLHVEGPPGQIMAPYRIFSKSNQVTFGSLEFRGFAKPVGPVGQGLVPVWDTSCTAKEISGLMLACPSTLDFIVCAKSEGSFVIEAEWGTEKCSSITLQVKSCICDCFKHSIANALDKLLDCPAARKLFVSIHGVHVECVEKDDFERQFGSDPRSPVAAWKSETNSVLIKCGNDHVTSGILFECTNAESRERHEKVDAEARAGNLSKKDYIKEKERIEYEGLEKHHSIAQACVKAGHWPPAFDRFGHALANEWSTFEKYMADPEQVKHAKVYDDWWDKACKGAYESKHK